MAKTRDHPLRAFVQEVTATLLIGRPHRTPGLGTFSICTRRATPDRCASTMAMFRASAELRAYASGGPLPTLSGRHAPAVRTIVRGMLRKEGITIPQLGRMAVVPVSASEAKAHFSWCQGTQCGFGWAVCATIPNSTIERDGPQAARPSS